MKFNHTFVLPTIILILLTTSCSLRIAKPFDVSKVLDEVARLRPSKTPSLWKPQLVDVLDTSREATEHDWINVGNSIAGYPSKMNLKPGRYEIRFICTRGPSYAYPYATIVVEAGKIYSTRCFNAVDGMIGVEVKESDEQSVIL